MSKALEISNAWEAECITFGTVVDDQAAALTYLRLIGGVKYVSFDDILLRLKTTPLRSLSTTHIERLTVRIPLSFSALQG